MNTKLKSFIRGWLPRTIRPQRILSGPLRGQRIVTSWHDYPAAILGNTERPLLDWFSANVRAGETWLDVGAHYGYTAIALCRLVGSAGRVFAFEPMLGTAGYLAQTRLLNDLPQLIVVPMALGIPKCLALTKLPTVRGMVDSTIQDRRWSETLLVARLDWLWPNICGLQVQIEGIKIDVQGMELDVLQGMSASLRAFHPKLVIEVHNGVNRNELLDLVESAGYLRQGVPIEPIEGESEPKYLDDRSYMFRTPQMS